ncbi:hypothetical protein FFF93_015810 [Arthrobacter sp. KBS0702]|uniref:hypothetical protein n=1 Tax=Arthrobacter sp. KBS0702 TaxID=2578107 RepID=UPI00110DBB87|nr:hypothetical protein [Arthrobacter sp. KBS0702]QDW31068.1 hypothetical protein FFF93_015810 [Arthrobacter sp. KBS0702]
MIDEILSGVSGNLFSGAIAFVFGLLARRAWSRWTKTRPAGQLWGVLREKRVELVLTTAPESSPRENSSLVFPSEAIAGGEVSSYLTNMLKVECRTRLSGTFPSTSWNRNLIVIGGPVHNNVTRILLSRLDAGVEFDGHAIVLADGRRFQAETTVDERGVTAPIADFGLVIRLPNPFSSKQHVTLLIGSNTHGCLIAARAMLHENVKLSSRAVAGKESFCLLATAHVVSGEVQQVQVVESWVPGSALRGAAAFPVEGPAGLREAISATDNSAT